jgi:hypothetical protein
MMLPSRQAAKWSSILETTIGGVAPKTVDELLEALNLGVTRNYTGLAKDIDLSAFSVPFVLTSIAKAAEGSGLRLFTHDSRAGWQGFHPTRFKASMLRAGPNGRIELAVLDESNRLVSRHSITPWREQQGIALAPGQDAPLKRMRLAKKWRGPPHARTKHDVGPIDVVYTWVDSADPSWQELIRPFKSGEIDRDRFSHNDELKHSIRSIELYAPWVRNIYIFSNCAPPEWFAESARVIWVKHDEVIPAEKLPTFNSHVIETFLHLIPNISENFIYFNDDFFLTGFVEPTDFFNAYGQTVARLEPYGVVPYLEQMVESGRAEDYQFAAVNAARLLYRTSGILPTQLHRHAPYAFKKSLFAELVHEFAEEVESTRTARFRTKGDYSFASFLYHHYARLKGACVENNEESMIVRHTNFRAFERRKTYLALRFFCMNDGGGSSTHEGFNKFKVSFLSKRYPFRSRAEL